MGNDMMPCGDIKGEVFDCRDFSLFIFYPQNCFFEANTIYIYSSYISNISKICDIGVFEDEEFAFSALEEIINLLAVFTRLIFILGIPLFLPNSSLTYAKTLHLRGYKKHHTSSLP